MAEEIELKLAIDPADVESLRRSLVLVGVAPVRTRLDAIYLDTSERGLRDRALALRLRREGSRWVQTLKSGHAPAHALMGRIEWESPARLVEGQPRLDLKALAASPLAEVLARARGRPKLAPVFRTRFVRTTWMLQRGKTLIEVALDVGQIIVARGKKTTRSPISEVELELKSGSPRRLLDLALELIGDGADALALVPLPLSKAERGYHLAAGERPAVAKASASGFAAALSEHLTSAAALRAVGHHALGVVLANAAALRAGRDAESIHQARVALRRLRSAIRLFDSRHDDFPRGLSAELQWLARALGAARDWDVFSDQTLPPFLKVVRASSAAAATAGEALLSASLERRDIERAAVLAVLSGARYARTILRLHRWIVSTPPKAETLKVVAPRALDRACRRLLDAARFFSALSAERRHEVRILAKRLRYSLDLLAVALPAADVARFTGQLAELQDELGVINDAVVAASLVAEHGQSVELIAQARDWFDRAAESRVRRAEELLLALSDAQPPWRAVRHPPAEPA